MQVTKESAMPALTSPLALVPERLVAARVPERTVSPRIVPKSWQVLKRLGDISVGTCLCIFALPIMLISAIGIVLVTGGNPFFAQERVAQNGRRFKMYKLRTMVKGAHEMRDTIMHLNEADGPVFKIRQDPRLHPLGGILRRTSIDELPNLFNVVLGDISLVGPRPALPSEVEHYDEYALHRLSVPQGVTCLWQVNGRSSVSFDEWMALDNQYIATWSPWRDMAILLKTVPAVMRKDGAH